MSVLFLLWFSQICVKSRRATVEGEWASRARLRHARHYGSRNSPSLVGRQPMSALRLIAIGRRILDRQLPTQRDGERAGSGGGAGHCLEGRDGLKLFGID